MVDLLLDDMGAEDLKNLENEELPLLEADEGDDVFGDIDDLSIEAVFFATECKEWVLLSDDFFDVEDDESYFGLFGSFGNVLAG